MDRYWVKRGGDADRWGNWYVIDRTASTSVAMCEDADMAQRIADLLNEDVAKKRFDAAVRSYTEANHA